MFLNRITAKALFIIAAFVTLIMTVGECTKDNGSAIQGPNEVWIQNMAYNPTQITVPVNTVVKWTNKDGVQHTVTSDDGLFDSGLLNPGATFTHQFTTSGTFAYHCNVHSMMHGTVIVQ